MNMEENKRNAIIVGVGTIILLFVAINYAAEIAESLNPEPVNESAQTKVSEADKNACLAIQAKEDCIQFFKQYIAFEEAKKKIVQTELDARGITETIEDQEIEVTQEEIDAMVEKILTSLNEEPYLPTPQEMDCQINPQKCQTEATK